MWKASLREKCPYSELFRSVFSCIRTKYGEILSTSLYLVWMRENTDQNNQFKCGKIRTRKTPNTKTFYAALHLRCLTEFWLRLWVWKNNFSKKQFNSHGFVSHKIIRSTSSRFLKNCNKWICFYYPPATSTYFNWMYLLELNVL